MEGFLFIKIKYLFCGILSGEITMTKKEKKKKKDFWEFCRI